MNFEKKAHLIILDGFGIGPGNETDAIYQAHTPYLDQIYQKYPFAKLKTDGACVGLPEFQTGGSEVGHITIGAGRAKKHLLTIINDQINSGEFFENENLKNLFDKAKQKNKIHLMGLASDGGIHSFLPHAIGLIKMAQQYGIENIYFHTFLDGRDVGERSAKEYLSQIAGQEKLKIATISGRFYAMDRDNNWERTEEAYRVLTDKKIKIYEWDWQKSLENFYQKSEKSDYYFPPVLLESSGQIEADDIVINFNYRTDRERQISDVLVNKKFDQFKNEVVLDSKNYGIFGNYCERATVIFDFEKKGEEKRLEKNKLGKNELEKNKIKEAGIKNTLGEIVAQKGGTQLRIAETEKFNHVTFFFSGETKEAFSREGRVLLPSPKCTSYAEKPEMAAFEQTEKLIEILDQKSYDLIVQNYANSDLVGHSGNFEAAKKSIEVLDQCLAKLVPKSLAQGYDVFITADHGNSDEMVWPDGEINAGHTKNLVPFIWVSPHAKKLIEFGNLGNIAPTILEVLGLEIPGEMTEKSLIA